MKSFSNDITYSYLGDKKAGETLADGTVNLYGYDGFGNECLALMDSGGIEQYTYRYFDRLSRLTGISGFSDGDSGANELFTGYEYDYRDNITSVNYPDSTTIEYEYNYLGKVVERRDRQDNITEYTYNAGGHLFQKNNIFELWEVDENDPNIVTLVRDSKPWQLYTHDALGRLTNVCLLEIEGEQQLQIATHSREYDGLGNITKTGDGHISGADTDVEYGYYPNGQISSIEYPGGKTVSYQSYGDDLVDEISIGGETVAEYDYIGEKVLDRRLPRIGEATWFTYDARGRVTGEEIYDIATDAAISTTTYAYKTNTDLVSSKTIDSSTQTYQYDDLERLTQYGTQTYSLNDISEELSAPTPDYNYYVDVENRVTDVNDLTGAQIADYSYDALGRRNKKIVYDGENTSITYYVYVIGTRDNRVHRNPCFALI